MNKKLKQFCRCAGTPRIFHAESIVSCHKHDALDMNETTTGMEVIAEPHFRLEKAVQGWTSTKWRVEGRCERIEWEVGSVVEHESGGGRQPGAENTHFTENKREKLREDKTKDIPKFDFVLWSLIRVFGCLHTDSQSHIHTHISIAALFILSLFSKCIRIAIFMAMPFRCKTTWTHTHTHT